MKRLFICIAMIFSFSFLCGFTSSKQTIENNEYIMLSVASSLNGQIVQSVDFSVESEFINQNSNSVLEELQFKKALTKEIENIRNEFLFSYALMYMERPNEEYKINKGVLLSEVSYNEESDSIGFKICFTSIGAWNYYHTSGNNQNEKPKQKTNPFLNKIESKGLFPFSSKIKISEDQTMLVGERYKFKYINAAKDLSFYDKLSKEYSPNFIYNYSSYNKNLKSDADISFFDNQGYLHHAWVVESETLNENNSIILYYYLIQKGSWIALAIILPLLGMIVSIIIIKIKEKKKSL